MQNKPKTFFYSLTLFKKNKIDGYYFNIEVLQSQDYTFWKNLLN